MRGKRIAILGQGFVSWQGGVDFLRLILGALSAQIRIGENKFYLFLPLREPSLAWPEPPLKSLWRRLRGNPNPILPPQPPHIDLSLIAGSLQEFWAHLIPVAVGNDPLSIAAACRTLRIDAAIPALQAMPDGAMTPWVGYVYDLQHRHFPQFFSPALVTQRDQLFGDTLRMARAVIVNSRHAADDIRRFMGDTPARVFSLPLCTDPSLANYRPPSLAALREKYAVPEAYVCICNQFWIHKDHATAFRALALIARQFPQVDMVCTGETLDFRVPDYFPALQKLVQELGMKKRIHILGSIPKDDQLGLLAHAKALVQPTLFEGGPGGGSVVEALSIGVPAIVSDIAINLELPTEAVTFFKAGQPEALAEAMRVRLRRQTEPRKSPRELFVGAWQQRLKCGEVLLEALRTAGMQT